MTTETQTLVERARLTDEERGRYVHSLRSGGAVFSERLEGAVLAKALWAVVNAIPDEVHRRDQTNPLYADAVGEGIASVGLWLKQQLESASMEKP